MPSPTVVIVQKELCVSQELAHDLRAHFAQVTVANNADELRTLLLSHRARLAVLDLELVSTEDIRWLARDFGELTIVCTHRCPNEQMWMEALNAGASEFCHPQDVVTILRASLTPPPRRMARAA